MLLLERKNLNGYFQNICLMYKAGYQKKKRDWNVYWQRKINRKESEGKSQQ